MQNDGPVLESAQQHGLSDKLQKSSNGARNGTHRSVVDEILNADDEYGDFGDDLYADYDEDNDHTQDARRTLQAYKHDTRDSPRAHMQHAARKEERRQGDRHRKDHTEAARAVRKDSVAAHAINTERPSTRHAAPAGALEENQQRSRHIDKDVHSRLGQAQGRRYLRRYFIIKSFNRENITRSIENGIWATQKVNEAKLNEAFNSSDQVLLVFSVNGSGHFQGFARMTSPIGRKAHSVWSGGDHGGAKPWGASFGVEWIRLYDLPFERTNHLHNPWNEDKPVKISRDGQELPMELGDELCRLFHEGADGMLHKRQGGGDFLPPAGVKRHRPARPPLDMPWPGPQPYLPVNSMMHPPGPMGAFPYMPPPGMGYGGFHFSGNGPAGALDTRPGSKEHRRPPRPEAEPRHRSRSRSPERSARARSRDSERQRADTLEQPKTPALVATDIADMTYEEYLEHFTNKQQSCEPSNGALSMAPGMSMPGAYAPGGNSYNMAALYGGMSMALAAGVTEEEYLEYMKHMQRQAAHRTSRSAHGSDVSPSQHLSSPTAADSTERGSHIHRKSARATAK
eukprot:jgi/Chlat1/519/Chrsp103S00992